jgi:hypothetical protein
MPPNAVHLKACWRPAEVSASPVTWPRSLIAVARLTVVGVRAWTGKNPTTCTADGVEDKVKQHDRAGCLFLQIR